MHEGDIRHFFRPSSSNPTFKRHSKKRPYELPIEKPYTGFFPLADPRPVNVPMINPRKPKRIKESAVKPLLKVRSKLEIMQWHFKQETPNCVVTAKKFFPDQPVKLRSIQN